MSDQIKPSPRLCRGCTNLSESHRFFALLTWIGQNSPETKGSKIRGLKMHSFGRPLLARLCFAIKLIHRETVLEMENASGDGKQQETAAFSSQRLSLEDRSWAAHLPGLKVSSCGHVKHSREVCNLCFLQVIWECYTLGTHPSSFAVGRFCRGNVKPLGSSSLTSGQKMRKKEKRNTLS